MTRATLSERLRFFAGHDQVKDVDLVEVLNEAAGEIERLEERLRLLAEKANEVAISAAGAQVAFEAFADIREKIKRHAYGQ